MAEAGSHSIESASICLKQAGNIFPEHLSPKGSGPSRADGCHGRALREDSFLSTMGQRSFLLSPSNRERIVFAWRVHATTYDPKLSSVSDYIRAQMVHSYQHASGKQGACAAVHSLVRHFRIRPSQLEIGFRWGVPSRILILSFIPGENIE